MATRLHDTPDSHLATLFRRHSTPTDAPGVSSHMRRGLCGPHPKPGQWPAKSVETHHPPLTLRTAAHAKVRRMETNDENPVPKLP